MGERDARKETKQQKREKQQRKVRGGREEGTTVERTRYRGSESEESIEYTERNSSTAMRSEDERQGGDRENREREGGDRKINERGGGGRENQQRGGRDAKRKQDRRNHENRQEKRGILRSDGRERKKSRERHEKAMSPNSVVSNKSCQEVSVNPLSPFTANSSTTSHNNPMNPSSLRSVAFIVPVDNSDEIDTSRTSRC